MRHVISIASGMGGGMGSNRMGRRRAFRCSFLGGLTSRRLGTDSLGKGTNVDTRTLPFCTNGGFCLVCLGACDSMHVITTPPSSVNGFNNRASG